MENEIQMTIDDLNINKRYTYHDYLNWSINEKVELIRGQLYFTDSAPSDFHQSISSNLHTNIGYALKSTPCKVFSAPYDVRLPISAESEITTVVQPDISIVCDPKIRDHRGCNGAPDWIIEILSPSTAARDAVDKFDIYQSSGVKEYWILNPKSLSIIVYRMNDAQRYIADKVYHKGDTIQTMFASLKIEVDEVFDYDL